MKRVLAHAALLVAPVLALGQAAALARPQAIACVIAMLVLAETEARLRNGPDPLGARAAGAPGARLALASALGLLATVWTAIGAPSIGPALWTWLGAPLIVLGIGLRAAAIRTLGSSFTSETVAAPGHALVTHGIYSRLRHPSDMGLLLITIGLAVLGGSVGAAALVTLVVAPSIALRIAHEERVLAERHAERHTQYRRAVRI